jgi:hypothetical protein
MDGAQGDGGLIRVDNLADRLENLKNIRELIDV